MLFEVQSKDIQSLVSFMGQVVPSKAFSVNHLLVKMGIDGDHLFMEANDGKHAARANKKVEVKAAGEPIYLNHGVLSQLIRKFKSEKVKVGLIQNRLVLQGTHSTYSIAPEKPTSWDVSFPSESSLEESVEMKPSDLSTVIGATCEFTGDARYNPNIAAIQLAASGTDLKGIATNLHLGVVKPVPTEAASDLKIFLQRTCAENISRLMKLTTSSKVVVGITDDGDILISAGADKISTKDQGSKMPDVENSIKGASSPLVLITAGKDELIRGVDAVTPLSDASRIKLNHTKGELSFSFEGLNKAMGDGKHTITKEKDDIVTDPTAPQEITIGVNAVYLTALLKSIESKIVRLGISSSRQPILIESEDGKHQCVLMPAVLPIGVRSVQSDKDTTKGPEPPEGTT